MHILKILLHRLALPATILAVGNELHANMVDSLAYTAGDHCSRDGVLPDGDSCEDDLTDDDGLLLLQVEVGVVESNHRTSTRSSSNGSGKRNGSHSSSSSSSSSSRAPSTKRLSIPTEDLQRQKQDKPSLLLDLWQESLWASVNSTAGPPLKAKIPEGRFPWNTSLLSMRTRDIGLSALDVDDKSVLCLAGALFILFCFVASFFYAADDDGKPQDSFAKQVMRSWSKPLTGIEADMYPAISGKQLQFQSMDIPLMIPLGPMMNMAAEDTATDWSVDILSSRGTIPFAARLMPASRGHRAMVQVLHQRSPNHPKVVEVSIDDALTIWDARGHVFGRLVQQPLNGGTAGRPSTLRSCCPDSALPQSTPSTPASSAITIPGSGNRFILEEASGRPARWTIACDPQQTTGLFMDVKWLPENQVLAIVERQNGHLLVANNYGVDAVLVLTCTLGLLAFELSMGDAWGQSISTGHTEEPTSTAASLLERLQHR